MNFSDIPEELVGGGDTLLHFHLADRNPTHQTSNQLQAVQNIQTKAGATYTLTEQDDIILADGGTYTLPKSKFGKEYEIIMTGSTSVIVNLTSPDEIFGETSVLLEVEGTALRFKAVSTGWVLI